MSNFLLLFRRLYSREIIFGENIFGRKFVLVSWGLKSGVFKFKGGSYSGFYVILDLKFETKCTHIRVMGAASN